MRRWSTGSFRGDIAGPGSMSQGIEATGAPIPIDLGISSHAWIVIGRRLLAGAEDVAVLQLRCISVGPKSARSLLTSLCMICTVAITKNG